MSLLSLDIEYLSKTLRISQGIHRVLSPALIFYDELISSVKPGFDLKGTSLRLDNLNSKRKLSSYAQTVNSTTFRNLPQEPPEGS